ncbi:MAG: hypothetical protein R3245_11410, partial [Kiloniellales bacterium]|nr:hypothetical protein [Kiloniellales bacterium]
FQSAALAFKNARKVNPRLADAYEMLKDRPGLRPAPYLASRGMKWIQHYAKPGLADEDLKAYLSRSHRIVSQGLPKKTRRALGLKQE